MNASEKNSVLQQLPSVNEVLDHPGLETLKQECGSGLGHWVREELATLRQELLETSIIAPRIEHLQSLVERVKSRARLHESQRLGKVINATGVVLHTGLGRAPLSAAATSALLKAAGACNVEVDLETGDRRYRGSQLLETWSHLTGAEDLLIVNNNAAATLLCLQGLCAGREVLISRGQLIEIGGSFRLPEIFELSGAILREVGTTNRTQLEDYERAITANTVAILHVHPSNYQIVGFTESPGIGELASLARRRELLCLDDIGSGALIEMASLNLGLEPSFPESLRAGADVVLGSGDKLLGGPQAGLLTGRHELIQKLRSHPLARALRVDKLTLAALDATLQSYLHWQESSPETPFPPDIPVLACLTVSPEELKQRANRILAELAELSHLQLRVGSGEALVGGGSLPGVSLPTVFLQVSCPGHSLQELSRLLRTGPIRIYPRIHANQLLLDLRSVVPGENSLLIRALRWLDGQMVSVL